MKYFEVPEEDCMYTQELSSLLGPPRSRPENQNPKGSTWMLPERVVWKRFCWKGAYLHGKPPSENLCNAGGGGPERVANSRC